MVEVEIPQSLFEELGRQFYEARLLEIQQGSMKLDEQKLVKEVENSITEFKKHKQEYEEERVKDQVQEILEGAIVLEWLRMHYAELATHKFSSHVVEKCLRFYPESGAEIVRELLSVPNFEHLLQEDFRQEHV